MLRKINAFDTGEFFMIMPSKSSFTSESFCNSLYAQGCAKASERLGSFPTQEQLQMADLFKAFSDMKKQKVALQGISGRTNEAFSIVKSYVDASCKNIKHVLPAQVGYALGKAILSWGKFFTLPKEIQSFVEESVKKYSLLESSVASRLSHFFKEIQLRIGTLCEKEKEDMAELLSTYQTQIGPHPEILPQKTIRSLLKKIDTDLSKILKKHVDASRAFRTLIHKTQVDLHSLQDSNRGKTGFGHVKKETRKKRKPYSSHRKTMQK